MTDATIVATPNPMDMKVETNSAPVEQQSTETTAPADVSASEPRLRGRSKELATTEPKTDLAEKPAEVEVKDNAASEPTQEDKDNELARENIRNKLKAEDLQRQLDASKPQVTVPSSEPNINDYKTLEEYQTDFKKWAMAEGKREERAVQDAVVEQHRQEKVRVEVATRENESRAKHADYDAVINPIVPVIGSVPLFRHFIANNPMGTEVMYELGKNPAILDQIMRSTSMWEAGERLLNIAARLKQPKAAPITNAPAPIKPVGSREALKPDMGQLASKDMNGYHALRKKQRLAEKGIRVH